MEDKSTLRLCADCCRREAPGVKLQKRMPPERALVCALCWDQAQTARRQEAKGAEARRRERSEYLDRADPVTGIKRGRAGNRVVGQNNRADRLGLPGRLTLRQWLSILMASQGMCAYCHRAGDINRLVIEHIVPLSDGGGNSPQNVCAACPRCNSSKGDLPVSLFLFLRQKASTV